MCAWKEAFAEYLTYVFEDETRPPEEAAPALAYRDSISLQSQATVTLTQQNPSTTIYPCAVEAEVQGATPSAAAASFTFPFGEPGTGWTLDRDPRVVGTGATANRSAPSGTPLGVWIL